MKGSKHCMSMSSNIKKKAFFFHTHVKEHITNDILSEQIKSESRPASGSSYKKDR